MNKAFDEILLNKAKEHLTKKKNKCDNYCTHTTASDGFIATVTTNSNNNTDGTNSHQYAYAYTDEENYKHLDLEKIKKYIDCQVKEEQRIQSQDKMKHELTHDDIIYRDNERLISKKQLHDQAVNNPPVTTNNFQKTTNEQRDIPDDIKDMYYKTLANIEAIKKFDHKRAKFLIDELCDTKDKCDTDNSDFDFNKDIRDYNIGASDYSKHKIQPWDIWEDYNLNPWDADIVKRVLREKEIPGVDAYMSRILDYQKIIHICLKRIQQLKQI